MIAAVFFVSRNLTQRNVFVLVFVESGKKELKVVMKARVWGVGGLGGFICAVEMSVPRRDHTLMCQNYRNFQYEVAILIKYCGVNTEKVLLFDSDLPVIYTIIHSICLLISKAKSVRRILQFKSVIFYA